MAGNGKVTLAAAVACALAVAVAGCGSDDGDASSAGAEGETIKIMAIGPVQAPDFSVPSIEVGARAAVEEVNEAGGIDGRKLELIVCNDENDPNKATGCARRAIEEDVAAIVGGYTAFEPQVVPIVERAGIPWIGPTALQNSTSKSYFLLGGEGATLAFAMGMYLVEEGCDEISAIAENLPPSKAAVELFQVGVQAGGGNTGEPAYGATNAADWGPVVAAATGDGADCVGILGSVPNTPKVVTALAQSGEAVTAATPLSLLPAQAVAALGDTADGIVLTSGYLPFSADAPAIQRLRSKAQAIDPEVPLDAILTSTYASVKVLAEAAKDLSTVDADALMRALPKVQGFDTGLGPVVDFSGRNPAEPFSRVVNTRVYILEARDGRVMLAQPEPIDTAPAFEAIAAADK